MNVKMTRQEARIVSITKIEQPVYSSRKIEAKLQTYSGNMIDITMIDTTAVNINDLIYTLKSKDYFDDIWENGKEGDLVMFVHFDDMVSNYFYRLS